MLSGSSLHTCPADRRRAVRCWWPAARCRSRARARSTARATRNSRRSATRRRSARMRGQRAYVNCVANAIVRELPAPYSDKDWEIEVFESEEINAFALPGGHIGVFTGIFKVAENQDELATVIGHEVAHVTQQHALKRYNREATTQIGVIGVAVAPAPARRAWTCWAWWPARPVAAVQPRRGERGGHRRPALHGGRRVRSAPERAAVEEHGEEEQARAAGDAVHPSVVGEPYRRAHRAVPRSARGLQRGAGGGQEARAASAEHLDAGQSRACCLCCEPAAFSPGGAALARSRAARCCGAPEEPPRRRQRRWSRRRCRRRSSAD